MPPRAPSEALFVAGAEQLASLIDAIEELLLVVSPEGLISYASSGFSALLGSSANRLNGQCVFSLLLEDDRPTLERLLRESSFAPKVRGRCRLRARNGEYR